MEDRHDESQSPARERQEASRPEAAVTSASGSSSLCEETLLYLRKRVEEAATTEESLQGAASSTATGDAAATEKQDGAFVLPREALAELGAWQRLEANIREALETESTGENGEAGPAPLWLECTQIEAVDSVGLGRLIQLHDLAHEKGRSLALIGVPQAVHTRLVEMGLDGLLPCYADRDAAVKGEPLAPPSSSSAAPETPADLSATDVEASNGPVENGREENDEGTLLSAPVASGATQSAASLAQSGEGENSSDAAAAVEMPTPATQEPSQETPTEKVEATEQLPPPTQQQQQDSALPVQAIVEAVRGDLRTMYDALVGEIRGRSRDMEQIRTNFNNLGKALNQVQGFLGEVATRLNAFEQHLNRLTGYFNERFRADKTSQNAFDRLHEELKFYRDDALFRSQKPVFMDLILLYDDVGRMLRDARDEDAANKFALLREVILEILYRRDVEVIEERPRRFDKTFQKALKRIPTSEEELDRTVAEVVRDGFRWGESILRPQEVVVRRFEGVDASEPDSEFSDMKASDTSHPTSEAALASDPHEVATQASIPETAEHPHEEEEASPAMSPSSPPGDEPGEEPSAEPEHESGEPGKEQNATRQEASDTPHGEESQDEPA